MPVSSRAGGGVFPPLDVALLARRSRARAICSAIRLRSSAVGMRVTCFGTTGASAAAGSPEPAGTGLGTDIAVSIALEDDDGHDRQTAIAITVRAARGIGTRRTRSSV